MKNNFLIVLAIIAVLLLITACSSQVIPEKSAPEKTLPTESIDTESTPLPSAKDIILINNFAFEPQELGLKAGTEVTWENNQNVAHTLVSSGLFESGVLNKGETFSFTFNIMGEYDYYCGIHPSMTGTVIVK